VYFFIIAGWRYACAAVDMINLQDNGQVAAGTRIACFAAGRLRYAGYGLLLVLVAVLGGCSFAPSQVEEPPAPLPQVAPGTWRAVDQQIYNASVYARHESEAYVRLVMDEWLWRVRQRTEEVFIPWYTGYWTQQWLSIKVSWYKLQSDEGEALPEERLVNYLQEQFYSQVLEPVSSFVDPHVVMEHATTGYLRELKDTIAPLPARYHIPPELFRQHLEAIPAIEGSGVPPQDASLYALLQASDLSGMAGYELLLAQIAAVNGSITPAPSADRLQVVARRAVDKLLGTLTVRGGAAAASAIVGGFWGMLISTGSAVWGVVEHDNDKPGMETQLRENLDAAMQVMWQDLVEDPDGGVMAVVHHISTRIESALFQSTQEPLSPYVLEPPIPLF
jgi:hypothetical protein